MIQLSVGRSKFSKPVSLPSYNSSDCLLLVFVRLSKTGALLANSGRDCLLLIARKDLMKLLRCSILNSTCGMMTFNVAPVLLASCLED
jgi:hypothetical protein